MKNNLQAAAFIFIGGTLLSCLMSGRWLLNGETNIINALASFNTISVSVTGSWTFAKGMVDFFNAIVTALSWDYPFLASPWALFIRIPLWVVSIGVVWGLVEIGQRIIDTVLSTIRSALATFTSARGG
jgi:hypothetical protein